jgi:hypothetical protein
MKLLNTEFYVSFWGINLILSTLCSLTKRDNTKSMRLERETSKHTYKQGLKFDPIHKARNGIRRIMSIYFQNEMEFKMSKRHFLSEIQVDSTLLKHAEILCPSDQNLTELSAFTANCSKKINSIW